MRKTDSCIRIPAIEQGEGWLCAVSGKIMNSDVASTPGPAAVNGVVVIDFSGTQGLIQTGFAGEEAPRFTYSTQHPAVAAAFEMAPIADVLEVALAEAEMDSHYDLSRCFPGMHTSLVVHDWAGVDEFLSLVFKDLGLDDSWPELKLLWTTVLDRDGLFELDGPDNQLMSWHSDCVKQRLTTLFQPAPGKCHFQDMNAHRMCQIFFEEYDADAVQCIPPIFSSDGDSWVKAANVAQQQDLPWIYQDTTDDWCYNCIGPHILTCIQPRGRLTDALQGSTPTHSVDGEACAVRLWNFRDAVFLGSGSRWEDMDIDTAWTPTQLHERIVATIDLSPYG